MMDVPLLTTAILRHATQHHASQTVTWRAVDGEVGRMNYAELGMRATRLAASLSRLGLRAGDPVGTLAWNTARHLELYYAIPGCGLVCHSINPRLFPNQIASIVAHAGDRLMFCDVTFLDLVASIGPALSNLEAVVVMTDRDHMPALPVGDVPLLCYEDLIDGAPDDFTWPVLDERSAAGLCYTSGTTGDPKGVVYSHRSTVLHSMASCWRDVLDIDAATVVMPLVPMFHVNAWGLPYSALMTGAKLVLPGPALDGPSIGALIHSEGVTLAAGVPTVAMALLDWAEATGSGLGPLRRFLVGGAPCTESIADRFAALGVEVRVAWGMTELSPIGLANAPKPFGVATSAADARRRRVGQGRPLFGVEVAVLDDDGVEVAHDGVAHGVLHVRGPWVAAGYLGLTDSAAHRRPGWFDTGDVVTIDQDSFVQIVDRTKDVIKSGGEWISSLALENVAAGHPAVEEAAVIGRPDERWGERPRLVVVLRPGAATTPDEILGHFAGRVAKWWVPDDLVVVDELPHTGTGKVLKSEVARRYGRSPVAGAP